MTTARRGRRRPGISRAWAAALAALLGLVAGAAMWPSAPAAAADPPPWVRVVGGAVGNPAVAASPDLLHTDAFVRTGTSLFHQRAARESTLEQDLGGITTFDPAATANDEGTFAFVTGVDGAVYFRLISAVDGSPSAWVGLGGISRRAPSASTDRDGTVHVFVVGADGGVWTRHRSGGATWSPWATLGGVATSDIAVSSEPQVFVRGVDGAVYTSFLRSGAWSNWFRFAGRIVGSPSVSPDGFLAVRGTDNQVYVPWDGGFIPTGGFITGDPTVGLWGPSGSGMWSNLIYGRGPDGAAYVQAWGRGRSPWGRIESRITSDLAVAALDPFALCETGNCSGWRIYAIAPDGALYTLFS